MGNDEGILPQEIAAPKRGMNPFAKRIYDIHPTKRIRFDRWDPENRRFGDSYENCNRCLPSYKGTGWE